ncbi:MAG: cyclic nucleotide-binding domain-containing protein [Thermodesulfobacteriota bacterium]
MFKIVSFETFQDGQIIFEEGSNGDWIYVVEEGEVEISKNVGGQRIVVETLKESDVFGEIAYIDKAPRSSTATAKGTIVVGIIDRDFFDTEFNKISADFQKIFKTVAFRLRKTTERSVDAQDEKGD